MSDGASAFTKDDEPGITSLYYALLDGKLGRVDSHWFYCWLRLPSGEQYINSMARSAVREQVLFNRAVSTCPLMPFTEF